MKKVFPILGLILLAAVFRFPELTRTGLWLDEGVSVSRAAAAPAVILSGYPGDPSPPLYYLLLKLWTGAAGTAEAALRFPSLLAGTASVILIYLLGRRIFGPAGALFSGVLAALSPLQIYFSTEARMYEAIFFFSLLSMWFFLDLLEGKGRGSALGYLAATGALLYLHNFAFSVPLLQNLYAGLFFLRPEGRRKFRPLLWLALQGVLFGLFLPWLGVILSQVRALRGSYWTPPFAPGDLLNTLNLYAGSGPLAAALSSLAVLGLARPGGRPGLLGLWLAVPVLAPIAVSLWLMPVYVVRITIPAQGAFLLLVGAGFGRLPRGRTPVMLGTAFLLSPVLISYYRSEVRQPLRAVSLWLEGNPAPGTVLVSPPWYRLVLGEYYGAGKDREVIRFRRPAPGAWAWKLEENLRDRPGWLADCQDSLTEAEIEEIIKTYPGFRAERIFPYFNFQAGRPGRIVLYRLDAERRRSR